VIRDWVQSKKEEPWLFLFLFGYKAQKGGIHTVRRITSFELTFYVGDKIFSLFFNFFRLCRKLARKSDLTINLYCFRNFLTFEMIEYGFQKIQFAQSSTD
jgi:hypothetical protein